MERGNDLNPIYIRIILAIILMLFIRALLYGQAYLPVDFIRRINDYKLESRFDEAIGLIEKQMPEFSDPANLKALLEAKMIKADLYRMKGLNSLSEGLLDSLTADNYSEIKSDCALQAIFSTIQGTLFLTQGELKKGYGAIKTAIELYSLNLGLDDTLLAPCYNKLGNYFYFNKMYDSAMVCYSRALELAANKNRNSEDRASYIQNIGIIQLELGDYTQAELSFLESLRLKESIYPPSSFSLGRIYLNLGKFYQGISILDKSFFYLEKAEKVFTVSGIPPHLELGKIYWNKGLIYYLTGDYNMAITYLFNARQIIETVFSENKQLLSALYSDIASVYTYTGEYKKAIYYYQLSLADAGHILNIKTCRNLANLYVQEGNHDQAKEFYRKALQMTREPCRDNDSEVGLTNLHFGEYMIISGNDSAFYYLNRAYEIFNGQSGFHDRDVAASLYNIGDYYYKKGQINQALYYNQKSLISISNSTNDTSLFYNPASYSLNSHNLLINILFNKAFYLNKYFHKNQDFRYLIASGKTYILCLEIIDQVRMKYRAEDSQTILSNDIYSIYRQAIEHFIELYTYTNDKVWLDHAFRTSERGKSMALLNKIKETNAKKLGLIPEVLSDAEKNIISNLNLCRNNIWEEEDQSVPDLKKLDYLRANQLRYEKKYDSLINYLSKDYPDYYKLKYDHSVVSIDKLKKFLNKDEIIIEYTLGEDYIYVFLVSKDDFEVKKVPVDSTLIQNIFALRYNLDFNQVLQYTYQDYINFQKSSHDLYMKLIQPVKGYIEGKKLIIIPDAELSYLSFESLIEDVEINDSIVFRNLPYLIKKCPVSYAASSTIFTLIKKGGVPVISQGVLALAPSSNIFTRSFLAQNHALAQHLKSRQDLPGAVWETETILKIMKGKKLIGDEATESEFKRCASAYDILHFATHTRIDDQNPLSSMLSFYPYDGNGEDGVLHTYEIYNLELRGELAVLSACSTGDGKLQKGEGVISLARAFSYAGMPSVVMTLWDVEDISTGNIIPSFYHLLGKGFDKDVALQIAKLNYINKTKSEIETHPAFWSGFVLYGNNRGFRQPRSNFYYILLVVLGSLIIFISFVLLRRYINFKKT